MYFSDHLCYWLWVGISSVIWIVNVEVIPPVCVGSLISTIWDQMVCVTWIPNLNPMGSHVQNIVDHP